MALEKIRQGVLEEAAAEAAKIIGEADSKRRELLDAASSRLSASEKERLAKEAARLAERKNQAVSNVIREERLEILKEKNVFIDAAFGKALEELKRMDAAHYRELMKKCLLALPKEVSGEIGTNSKDEKTFNAAFLKEVNTGRPATGQFKPGAANLAIDGGVVVSAGKYRIDLSFASLLDAVRKDKVMDIAAAMFGKESDGR